VLFLSRIMTVTMAVIVVSLLPRPMVVFADPATRLRLTGQLVCAVGAGFDFNGDGCSDFAVGAPETDISRNGVTQTSAGSVTVFYGAANGTRKRVELTQGRFGLADTPEGADHFGQSLAYGNFNADRFDDLAIGTPGENSGAGVAHVAYGSPTGLTGAERDDMWYQAKAEGGMLVEGTPEQGDSFGFSLVASDFVGDSADDLVVGVPFEDVGPNTGLNQDAGAVNVLPGSVASSSRAGGITLKDSGFAQRILFQGEDRLLLSGEVERADNFGYSLAAGHFHGAVPGRSDLAIGIPGETKEFPLVKDRSRAGAVQVIMTFDVDQGPVPCRIDCEIGLSGYDRIYDQESGWATSSESRDGFGYSMATGNLESGGHDELVISAPFEDDYNTPDTGVVFLLRPRRDSFKAIAQWDQDSREIAGQADAGDRFGTALASGRFDQGISVDLAVGVPGEEPQSTITDAGFVNVIYTDGDGKVSGGSGFWQPIVEGDGPEPLDAFGETLRTINVSGNATADLLVGAPEENAGQIEDSGAVRVLEAQASGLQRVGIKLRSLIQFARFGLGL
jgi:hypothetical protein